MSTDPAPAALDLVGEARQRHKPSRSQPPCCLYCATDHPCLTAILADALEQAQSNYVQWYEIAQSAERELEQVTQHSDEPLPLPCRQANKQIQTLAALVESVRVERDAARADAAEQRARAERIETAYRDLTHSEMCGFACGCDAAVAAALAPPEHRRG